MKNQKKYTPEFKKQLALVLETQKQLNQGSIKYYTDLIHTYLKTKSKRHIKNVMNLGVMDWEVLVLLAKLLHQEIKLPEDIQKHEHIQQVLAIDVTPTIKIGVVGFSQNHFDQNMGLKKLKKIIDQIMTNQNTKKFELVSGYTNSGVPRIAYELADTLGLITVGFSAKQALDASSGVFPVNKQIIVGNKFGDESKAFIQYIDILIRIGGGKQSRHESELFKKKNQGKNLSEILFEEEVEWYGKK